MYARTLQALTRKTSFVHSGKHNENCDGGAYRETCRGEMDFRIQVLLHPAVQEHDHIRKEAVQKLIRDTPEQRSIASEPKAKSRVQSVQRKVEGYDLQHGEHGVHRDLRDHSQNTMLQLYDILAERYCILYMRNMPTTFRESSKTQQ